MLFPSRIPRLSCGFTLFHLKILPAAATLCQHAPRNSLHPKWKRAYRRKPVTMLVKRGIGELPPCIHSGCKDTAVTQPKHRKTKNINTPMAPFRTNSYVQHMPGQHKYVGSSSRL